MKTLGRIPELQARDFLARNPLAVPGSRSADGTRRIVTHAQGRDLQELTEAFSVFGGSPGSTASLTSIPLLSPGIKDPIPCVPCQKTHDREWAEHPGTIGEHMAILQRMVNGKIPFPPAVETARDGIVYVGNGKDWPGILAGTRLLRDSGCQLPVQVWFRGGAEPMKAADIESLGDVRLIDTVDHAKQHGGARILGGGEAKLWAISHCGLRRILSLDADACVVADPAPLFEQLERGAPFQFWRDRHGKMESGVKWEKIWKKGSGGVPQIQGGQLLLDIPRCWKLVCITHWMNQHSDFYHKHMWGDQDTWRVALAAIGDTTLWQEIGRADWNIVRHRAVSHTVPPLPSPFSYSLDSATNVQ